MMDYFSDRVEAKQKTNIVNSDRNRVIFSFPEGRARDREINSNRL